MFFRCFVCKFNRKFISRKIHYTPIGKFYLSNCMETIKITQVAKLTIAAETLALGQALEACFVMKSFLCEMLNKKMSNEILPIKCFVDNKSLIHSIYWTKPVTKKRLKIDICIICEMISKKEIYSIKWCKSELQLADYLTKGTAKSRKFLTVLKNGSGLLG